MDNLVFALPVPTGREVDLVTFVVSALGDLSSLIRLEADGRSAAISSLLPGSRSPLFDSITVAEVVDRCSRLVETLAGGGESVKPLRFPLPIASGGVSRSRGVEGRSWTSIALDAEARCGNVSGRCGGGDGAGSSSEFSSLAEHV